uniref:Neurexophilin and PC-esterase domain family, member 3 n=1 Tax=Neogobius melanostomus TaxID=47308 RepID=A0A8C6V6Q9_9GOBI
VLEGREEVEDVDEITSTLLKHCFVLSDYRFMTSSQISGIQKLSPSQDQILSPRCQHLRPPDPPTDPLYSLSFSIVLRDGGWRVGDELMVRIQLRDYNGNPKKSGGDYLTSRLHNRMLGAGVVGQVQDHLNGTFTAVFPLLWNGTADVEVLLVQTSESITVLKRVTEEQPDRIWFSSDFRFGSVTETSTCNVCLDADKAPLCNFTDLHTGEQWFCYKPKTLDCNTRVSHVVVFRGLKINKEERLLFQRGINMKVLIKALGKATATILPKTGETKTITTEPSGYYYGNEWRPLGGPKVHQFNNASVIACLKGKQVHMFGDSTTRQFYEFITKKLPNLLKFDKHSTPQCGPFLAVDHTNDIMMTFRCHGPPLRNYKINLSQLQYVANELDRLNGGPNTVVVVGVWAHFGSFPMEVYYQRLMAIRRAVGRLLNRAPGTKVIIRTANMKDMNVDSSLYNSDWYSLQRDKVLRAVFKHPGVLLLEAWEMVQAHYLPHNLHPPPGIIKLMVDMILSNTCPENGG